jgi:hypothetical protein
LSSLDKLTKAASLLIFLGMIWPRPQTIEHYPNLNGTPPVAEMSLLPKSKKDKAVRVPRPVYSYSTNCEWLRRVLIKQYGLTGGTLAAAIYIFDSESDCNHLAVNPSSGAYGICQALPGIKLATAGKDWRTNPYTQIKWCFSNMRAVYGSWEAAMRFSLKNHWW